MFNVTNVISISMDLPSKHCVVFPIFLSVSFTYLQDSLVHFLLRPFHYIMAWEPINKQDKERKENEKEEKKERKEKGRT